MDTGTKGEALRPRSYPIVRSCVFENQISIESAGDQRQEKDDLNNRANKTPPSSNKPATAPRQQQGRVDMWRVVYRVCGVCLGLCTFIVLPQHRTRAPVHAAGVETSAAREFLFLVGWHFIRPGFRKIFRVRGVAGSFRRSGAGMWGRIRPVGRRDGEVGAGGENNHRRYATMVRCWITSAQSRGFNCCCPVSVPRWVCR